MVFIINHKKITIMFLECYTNGSFSYSMTDHLHTSEYVFWKLQFIVWVQWIMVARCWHVIATLSLYNLCTLKGRSFSRKKSSRLFVPITIL